MSETVIEYVLGRLKAVGVDDIFGVPGDYAFYHTLGNGEFDFFRPPRASKGERHRRGR